MELQDSLNNALSSLRRAAIASLIALPSFGCAAMLGEPLPSEDTVRTDQALVGIWGAGDLVIRVGEGARYDGDSRFRISIEGDHHVIEDIGEEEGAYFEAFASQIDGKRYLSLNLKSLVDAEIDKELGGDSKTGREVGSESAGLFLAFEYQLAGDRLTAWTLDMEDVLDAVDDGDIDGDIDSGCDLDLGRLVESGMVDEDDREGLEWAEDFLDYGFICKTVWTDGADLLEFIQENGTERSESEAIKLKREGTTT